MRCTHRPHGKAIVANVFVNLEHEEIGVGHTVGEDRVAGVERTRPIVAIRTRVVNRTAPTIAPSREEQGIAIVCRQQIPFHAVLRCPLTAAVGSQFLKLLLCRHSPRRSPVDVSSIVLRVQFGLAIHRAILAVSAILYQLDVRAIDEVEPLVVAPVVIILCLGLSQAK